MSGPLEHAGVEDVLSSIRRLVSEENRSARPDRPTRPETSRPRLVLTPALRVPASPNANAPKADDGHFPNDDLVKAPDLGGVAEAGQIDDPAGHDKAVAFLDHEHTVARAATSDVFHLRHPNGVKDAEVKETEVDSAEAENAAGQEAEACATAQDVEPVVANDPAWKNPDETLFRAAEDHDAAAGAGEDQVDAADAQPLSSADVTQLHNASARHRAAAVVRKIAEMEAATGQDPAQTLWEPDASQAGPFGASSQSQEQKAWAEGQPVSGAKDQSEGSAHSAIERSEGAASTEDLAEPLTETVVETVAQDIEDSVSEAAFFEMTDDETTLLDEDALRDMVLDIVRQELQGALGEKITRNVRKLVRREIHRALASHNLL